MPFRLKQRWVVMGPTDNSLSEYCHRLDTRLVLIEQKIVSISMRIAAVEKAQENLESLTSQISDIKSIIKFSQTLKYWIIGGVLSAITAIIQKYVL